MNHVSVKPLLAVLLLPLALSLTACAHKPCPPPAALPTLQLPTPPSVSTPLSPTDYSISASETIKTWREKLKATQMMSAP